MFSAFQAAAGPVSKWMRSVEADVVKDRISRCTNVRLCAPSPALLIGTGWSLRGMCASRISAYNIAGCRRYFHHLRGAAIRHIL